MRNFILILAAALLIFAPGCGNLSPRQQPRIDDNEGQIQEMESMANSMKAEIMKLQSQADIQNSKLDKIQQGLANFQSTNENSGVQILSGSGGLIVAIISILGATVLVFIFRTQTARAEKTASLLAERIVSYQDPELEDLVFQAAMYTDVEENVLKVMKKFQA
jgi:hypothetical protein